MHDDTDSGPIIFPACVLTHRCEVLVPTLHPLLSFRYLAWLLALRCLFFICNTFFPKFFSLVGIEGSSGCSAFPLFSFFSPTRPYQFLYLGPPREVGSERNFLVRSLSSWCCIGAYHLCPFTKGLLPNPFFFFFPYSQTFVSS